MAVDPSRPRTGPRSNLLSIYCDGAGPDISASRRAPLTRRARARDGPPNAGWGVVVADRTRRSLAQIDELWGPVITDRRWEGSGFIGADEATNNTGELSALFWAFDWVHNLAEPPFIDECYPSDVVVYSDSQYGIDVAEGRKTAHANQELVRSVRGAFSIAKAHLAGFGFGLVLAKVRAHSGVHFNDVADSLAKRGRETWRVGRLLTAANARQDSPDAATPPLPCLQTPTPPAATNPSPSPDGAVADALKPSTSCKAGKRVTFASPQPARSTSDSKARAPKQQCPTCSALRVDVASHQRNELAKKPDGPCARRQIQLRADSAPYYPANHTLARVGGHQPPSDSVPDAVAAGNYPNAPTSPTRRTPNDGEISGPAASTDRDGASTSTPDVYSPSPPDHDDDRAGTDLDSNDVNDDDDDAQFSPPDVDPTPSPPTDSDAWLRSLDLGDIYFNPYPSLDRIPRGVLSLIIQCRDKARSLCLHASSQTDELGWRLWAIHVQLLLTVVPASKQPQTGALTLANSRERNAALRHRADLFLRGHYQQLFNDLRENPLYDRLKFTARDSDDKAAERAVARVNKLCRSGQLSRAIGALTSHGLLPATEATFSKLEDLQFDEDQADIEPYNTPDVELEAFDWREELGYLDPLSDGDPERAFKSVFLSSLPHDSGTGPTRDRIDYLLQEKDDASSLLDFHIAIIEGRVPVALRPFFASSTTIALRKLPQGEEPPGFEKPRPLAIGNADRRVSGSLALLIRKEKLGSFFLQHGQLAIAVPGGCEAAAHALRVLSQHEPENADIQLDGDSMFQRVRRSKAFETIKEEFAEMMPMTRTIYGQSCVLFYHVAGESRPRTITCRTGAGQGCPLGSFFACSSIAKPLTHLRIHHPKVTGLALTDDIRFNGPVSDVAAAYSDVAPLLRDAGYLVNESKSKVRMPLSSETRIPPVLARFEVTDPNGLTFGKVPIGTPEFETAGTLSIVNKRVKLFDKIDTLNCKRARYHLLRFCTSRNHNYWERSTPPDSVITSARAHDDRLWQSIRALLQLPHMQLPQRAVDRARLQSTLPVSGGGLGLGSAQLDSKPAYYGSWKLIATTLASFPCLADLIVSAFPETEPTGTPGPEDPTPPSLPPCITAALDARSFLNAHRPDDNQLPVISLDPSSNNRRNFQKKASVQVYRQLRQSLDDDATPIERTRLVSCSTYGSGHFLNAFPRGNFIRTFFDISDDAFLANIQERLGLNVLGANPPFSCKLCHRRFEHGTAHAHICPKLPKGECGSLRRGLGHGAGIRHKRLQNEFVRMLNSLGLSWDADENGANPRVFLPSGNKVDVIISGLGEGGRPLALDFRVCYPLQNNAVRGTFDAQEREKNEKYKMECDDAGWDFEPFVVDTFGGFGPAARSVFQRMVKHAAQIYDRHHWRHSWSASSFSTHWLQRISLVIARANYEMHRAVIPSTPNLESELV